MPRTKKPAGKAIDQRNGRRAEIEATPIEAPTINRKRFLAVTLAAWDAYWADAVAATQTQADLVVALTWIESVDQYWRLKRAADNEPTTEGSMGQTVVSPLYAAADRALQAAERAGRQLGIGAKNRADLGLALVAEAHSLAKVNERYRPPPTAGGRDDDDDDPRVIRLNAG